MEPKFKLKYIVNKDLLKDLYFYISFLRPVRVVCNLVLLVYFVYDICMSIIYGYLFSYVFIIVLFFYAYEIFACFRGISLTLKRNREMNVDTAYSTYEIFDNYFEMTMSNGAKSHVEFSSIKKITQTKKLFIFMSGARLAYWFPKDAFEVGNADEFKCFLREKGYKVK